MLITDEYKKQNESLHESNPAYGTSGHRWAYVVDALAGSMGLIPVDLLDYGAGKGTMAKNITKPYKVHQYDPCIPGMDEPPDPAVMVTCTDVLEHIEPDCLDAVLDDLQRVTKHIGFFTISTKPAKKKLPDGRNAHLIQEPLSWWMPKLTERFNVIFCQAAGEKTGLRIGLQPEGGNTPGEVVVVVEAK